MEEENKQNKIKPDIVQTEMRSAAVETYAEDMAKVMESETGGLVKKIIQGEEENEAEKKNLSPESRKNKIFMFFGVLLIFFALVVIFFFVFKNQNNTVPIQKQFVSLIFNNQSISLEISGLKKDEIVQAIFNEVSKTKVKAGGVEGIYLTENKQIIGLRRFITLINGHFVPSDNTLFVSDNFLLGVVKNQADVNTSGTGFFLLLKVRSATDIFDSLRAWEPNLLNDLHGFLGINLSNDTNYLFTKNFTDGIIENKNARILYDKNGNMVLMYIYADDNSVIITDSQNAAHEIMLRLASIQPQQ
jgi:hypothetical protein